MGQAELRVLAAVLAAGLHGCCSDALCNEVLDVGRNYRLELVEPVDATSNACAELFGLAVGSRIALRDTARREVFQPGHYCSNDCYVMDARPALAGASFEPSVRRPDGTSRDVEHGKHSVAQGAATLDGGCEGRFDMEVRRPNDPELPAGPIEVEEDGLVLFNLQFSAFGGATCPEYCTARWIARVSEGD